MKASEVYLRAAELVANNRNVFGTISDGACDILGCKYNSMLRKIYFQRRDLSDEFQDLIVNGEFLVMTDIMSLSEAQECRVVALCLMSAIAAWDESHG